MAQISDGSTLVTMKCQQNLVNADTSYGLKLHLMVTESGVPVEFFLTPGSFSDVWGLRCYPFDLPQGAVVYANKAYCNYGIEDALAEAGIMLKPLRKKNSKRQYK